MQRHAVQLTEKVINAHAQLMLLPATMVNVVFFRLGSWVDKKVNMKFILNPIVLVLRVCFVLVLGSNAKVIGMVLIRSFILVFMTATKWKLDHLLVRGNK